MANTTDIELGNIDTDKAMAIEIKHDDKMKDDMPAYIQVHLEMIRSCSIVILCLCLGSSIVYQCIWGEEIKSSQYGLEVFKQIQRHIPEL